MTLAIFSGVYANTKRTYCLEQNSFETTMALITFWLASVAPACSINNDCKIQGKNILQILTLDALYGTSLVLFVCLQLFSSYYMARWYKMTGGWQFLWETVILGVGKMLPANKER